MDRRRLARPRARRQLFQPLAAGLAARRIQAAARGFLARRRLQRQKRGLMSPADVRRIKKKYGQVKTQGVFPKYRIGSLIGTDKSSRKVNPAKVDVREVRQHYDFNHQVTQNQVAIFGFSDAGSIDQQLKIGCMALAQMIFRRCGMKATHGDVNVDSLHTDTAATSIRPDIYNVYIGYQSVTVDGNTNHTSAKLVPSSSWTLNALRTQIFDSIIANVSQGYFPATLIITKVFAWDNSATPPATESRFAYYDLENVMIHMNAMTKYKYQNVTPSTGAGTEISSVNDVNANPLSGRVYQFKGPTPRLRTTIKDNEAAYPLDQLDKIEDLTADSAQGTLACEAFRTGAAYSGALKHGYHQPFRSVGVFSNCTHEDKLYMPPGGYKQMIKKTAVKMNFKRFVIATARHSDHPTQTVWIGLGNQIRIPRIGTSTMWAIEPSVRTDANETVKLIVNRELYYTAKAVVGDRKQIVRSSTIVQNGADFGS